MAEHAQKVAETIQAPTAKEQIQQSIIEGSNNLVDGGIERQHAEYEKAKRETAVKELKDLEIQMELKRIDEQLKKTEPLGEGDLANPQKAQLWQQIEQNMNRYKKESQQSYKEMLDEQIRHKQMLEKQGTMT